MNSERLEQSLTERLRQVSASLLAVQVGNILRIKKKVPKICRNKNQGQREERAGKSYYLNIKNSMYIKILSTFYF